MQSHLSLSSSSVPVRGNLELHTLHLDHTIQTETFITPQAESIKQLKTAQLLTIRAASSHPQSTGAALAAEGLGQMLLLLQVWWSSANSPDLGRNDPKAGRMKSSQLR